MIHRYSIRIGDRDFMLLQSHLTPRPCATTLQKWHINAVLHMKH